MRRTSSTEKLAVIALGLLAVLSPLYIDSLKRPIELEPDESGGGLALWLPLVLLFLIVAISLTSFMDQRFMRFDPYWIHRVGGSSGGLLALLLLLSFVLKCKSS